MNNTLTCKVSLSKKLRALVDNGASLVLTVNDINRGLGNGTLSLTSDGEIVDIASVLEGLKFQETSIMITPISIQDTEVPTGRSVASIFSTTPSAQQTPTVIERKIAAVTPPEKHEVPDAIVPGEEVETPAVFKQLDVPECRKYVMSLRELDAAVEKAKNKVSDIDLDKIPNPRQRAVAMEMREQMESIEEHAFIVNEKVGCLSLNDLGIRLPMNTPFDLSKISAKRIAQSRELKDMMSQNFVHFISPSEVDAYRQKVLASEAEKIGSLEVYDNHAQAEAAIESQAINSITKQSGRPVSPMEVSETDMNNPTEEESMIINLTSKQNIQPDPVTSGATRKTVHGSTSSPSQSSRPVSDKQPTVRPIASRHKF